MSVGLLHHRLAVVAALMALISYAGGAGSQFVSGLVAGVLLVVAFFWRPSLRTVEALERVWLPLAVLLVVRAAYHALQVRDDIVLPVVDLLLLLLIAEAFRPEGAQNDARLYALSFALLLAATAYRPGPLFLIGFSGFLIIGTTGLMVGHLKRRAAKAGDRPPVISRRFLLGSMGVAAGVLLLSGAVFVVFPRASQAWPGRIGAPPTAVAGFQDRVSLGDHGARILPNPGVVLRVEFPNGRPSPDVPLHWRGRSYDFFDGESWSRTRTLPASSGRRSWYQRRWGGEVLEQNIYASRLDVPVLFALHPLLRVIPDSPIHPVFDNAGDFNYWGSSAPVYSAFSVVSQPSPQDLREAAGAYYPGRGVFLQLPMLDARVGALADSLARPEPTRYDKTMAILRYLHDEFSYTLELPGSANEASLEHFLFERRAGHCEYFSTAMVMLLRSVGIHSREVNGFLGGEWNEFGNYLAVTQNEAHAWVEVWFPEFGWVTFDPTPPGRGGAVATQVWNWPGRFILDGVRHRWNKWVLDYDTDSQVQILGSVRGALAAESRAPDAEGRGWGWVLPVGLALVLACASWLAFRRLRRTGTGTRVESVLFLKLRQACVRAGVPDANRLSAERLVEAVMRLDTPPVLGPGAAPGAGHAAAAVGEFVSLYLRARFGPGEPSPADVERLKDALASARKALPSRARHGGRRAVVGGG